MTRRHPRTPSSKGKTRSSTSRTPLEFLRSPTKTVDTKNKVQRKFKDFVKCLADTAGEPCELLCDHDVPRKVQLQYLTGTRDDGRYYRVCDDTDCEYYYEPQYTTQRLPTKFASMLNKRRKLFDAESSTIEAVSELERELAAQMGDRNSDTEEPATPAAGPSRNRTTSATSRRAPVTQKYGLDWDESSEEDATALPSSPCAGKCTSLKKDIRTPEPERNPCWVVCAYTENGKPPLVYEFTFGLGTGPSQIFGTFQIAPKETIAFFTQRNGAQWTYMHAEDIGFVDALVEDRELFVWVKSGLTDCPDIEKYTGGYGGPVWPRRKGSKGKSKATTADSKDIIDLTI